MQTGNNLNYPTTITIITICVIMFLLSIFLGGFTGSSFSFSEVLEALGAESTELIIRGEIWRLILAAFLHADLIHIAFNMYALWSLGRYVEEYFGSKNLYILFITSAIGGSLLGVLVEVVFSILNIADVNSLYTISVGASGGIFGVAGFILANRFNKYSSSSIVVDDRSLLFIVLLNIGYGFIVPGINNLAHLGGLATGFVIGVFLRPENFFHKKDFIYYTQIVIFIILVLFTIISFLIQFINFLFF